MEIPVPEKPHAASIPEAFLCKSRLQEYTQKASIPLPVYQTFLENDKNVPHFRSQVWVDGLCFMSSMSYPNKKLAEQDAARHALISIREKIKNEGHMRILEDTVFCKLIVNEYALKMDLTPLSYTTNKTDSSMFISSLELNGVTHVGQMCKKKKQAEQSAARTAILSILASESNSIMSETVKSKYKLYDALQKVKESPIIQHGGSNNELGAMIPSTEDKNEAIAVTGPPPGEIPQPSSLVPFSAIFSNVVPEPTTEATHESVHIFKKPKIVEASALPLSIAPPSPALPVAIAPPSPALPQAIAPPSLAPEAPIVPHIEFVPPVSEQTPIAVKKQNRKKRKPKKKSPLQNPTPITMIPQSSAPAAFSMAQ